MSVAGARGGPNALQALPLTSDARRRLRAYIELLAHWSTRVNLTGARTEDERVQLLIAPVIAVSQVVRPGRVLDLGSGNGSPGLVLAALHPENAVTLIEPRIHRWAFLREAARAIGRPEIEVLRLRYEAYTGPAADTLTIRALRVPLAAAVALVRPGGRVIVLGARPAEDERFQEIREDGRCAPGAHIFQRTLTG